MAALQTVAVVNFKGRSWLASPALARLVTDGASALVLLMLQRFAQPWT